MILETPKVSVIMPVFNGAAYLAAAMDSILAQTLADFELIVIDDGSTDSSLDIARRYQDNRIVLLSNGENRGLPYTRNRGIDAARGQYIAFLDSDDIALPHRLATQVSYLDANPAVTGVGAGARPIDAQGNVRGRDWHCPGDAAFCKAMLFFKAYINTSTFIARSEVLKSNKFDLHIPIAEDFNLYSRLSENHNLCNLDSTLILCRTHISSTTATRRPALRESIIGINRRQLAALGIAPTDEELCLHRHLEWLDQPVSVSFLKALAAWLLRLVERNDQLAIYQPAAFRKAAGQRWHAACEDALRRGQRLGWPNFYGHSLWRDADLTLAGHLKLAARLLKPSRAPAAKA